MKGIILAGGYGTRLHPLTLGVSKQLLPIHDKPMIYYPLSILMLAGIKEILIISTKDDLPNFKKLLKNGSQLGIKFYYKVQPEPKGIAEAFIIGRKFIGKSNVCLILGDNLIYGSNLKKILKNSIRDVKNENKAILFGSYVNDPHRFGVVEFDSESNVLSLEEKPDKPKSNFAVIGLYFYPNDVINIVNKVNPSNRGELEITSLNQNYLKNDRLKVNIFGRGQIWMDTGTHSSLFNATNFVKATESVNNLKIACLEEIALLNNWINIKTLSNNIKSFTGEYYEYLNKILNERNK